LPRGARKLASCGIGGIGCAGIGCTGVRWRVGASVRIDDGFGGPFIAGVPRRPWIDGCWRRGARRVDFVVTVGPVWNARAIHALRRGQLFRSRV